jgi:hypothetical protein
MRIINEECGIEKIVYIDYCCFEYEGEKSFLYCNYSPDHKGFVMGREAIKCIKKKCRHYSIYSEKEIR